MDEEEELFDVGESLLNPGTYNWEDKYRPGKHRYVDRSGTNTAERTAGGNTWCEQPSSQSCAGIRAQHILSRCHRGCKDSVAC